MVGLLNRSTGHMAKGPEGLLRVYEVSISMSCLKVTGLKRHKETKKKKKNHQKLQCLWFGSSWGAFVHVEPSLSSPVSCLPLHNLLLIKGKIILQKIKISTELRQKCPNRQTIILMQQKTTKNKHFHLSLPWGLISHNPSVQTKHHG